MKKLTTCFLAAIPSFVVCLGGVSAASAAPSSYQLTCSNISLSGNVLSAVCRRRNQTLNRTSIVLRGIENIDGTLRVINPGGIASFQLTCRNTSVNGSQLSGSCRKINQTYVNTSTNINGIENINGVLTYTSRP
jgi:hypothetical protein